MSEPRVSQKLVVEAIGTFFFVLAIGFAVATAPDGFAPLAIGSALMVMIYAGGHISGGHFNPAVTLAVHLRGRMPASEVLPYWAAQIGGAILAAIVFLIVQGNPPGDAPGVRGSGDAFIVELLFTFALAWVVLHVATTDANDGNSFYGLAIGFTVTVGAYAVGGISGGAFNPAVAIGATIMGLFRLQDIWIYIIACPIGAAAAAAAFSYVTGHQGVTREPPSPAPPV